MTQDICDIREELQQTEDGWLDGLPPDQVPAALHKILSDNWARYRQLQDRWRALVADYECDAAQRQGGPASTSGSRPDDNADRRVDRPHEPRHGRKRSRRPATTQPPRVVPRYK
jgi:hypothetical protein